MLQVSLDAEDIRNEKVKVLRSMQTVRLEDVVLGQYRSRTAKGVTLPGYLDDDTVPEGRSVSLGAHSWWGVGRASASKCLLLEGGQLCVPHLMGNAMRARAAGRQARQARVVVVGWAERGGACQRPWHWRGMGAYPLTTARWWPCNSWPCSLP